MNESINQTETVPNSILNNFQCITSKLNPNGQVFTPDDKKSVNTCLKRLISVLNPNANIFVPLRLNREAISSSNDTPNTKLVTTISYDKNVTNELNSSTVNVSVTEENDLTTLNEIRSRYPDKIIKSYLNINRN